MIKKFTLLLCLLGILSIPQSIFAQAHTITGQIKEAESGDPLSYAKVLVKGTSNGTIADEAGKFSLSVDFGESGEATLVVSSLGYAQKDIKITPESKNLKIKLANIEIRGTEVVITGSRVSETILESPVAIDKMTISDITNAASGDFYQSIGNLKGVDIVSSSINFKAIQTRGFNTTSPVRSVQFIDGVDNQAPGLNFPIGNMLGASDIDLSSIELIRGAASALYGPNAFQGVISMQTKNPYDYQGLTVMLRGGSRSLGETHLRYAHAFGEKQKLAVKVTGTYFRAQDWPAEDPEANRYGDIETTQDLSAIVQQAQFDTLEYTPEEIDDWVALNNYLGFNPVAAPGKLDIEAPGYMESEIADYQAKSIKATAGLYYKIKDSLEIMYEYKIGQGTGVYQGTNRYSINNILFQQHKLQLTGKNFFVRAYTTQENAGDSYDLVFTSINLSKEGVPEFIGDYLKEYFGIIDTLTNGFDEDADQWMADSAHSSAARAAANSWFAPGTHQFDSLYSEIINNPDLQEGSKFTDRSSLQHVEGQYNFNFDFADIIAGANVRRYDPQSFGTIFSDTLLNPGDTLDNGRNDPDAEYKQLSIMEYGGYVQISRRLLEDKLRLSGSIRFDKNQNFDMQMSPRLSGVYSWNNHNLRLAGQSAFRSPTLQNQYILLDLGPIKLVGNLNGYNNLYTKESLDDFNEIYDSSFVIDPTILDTISLAPIKPEQVRSIEAGYRGVINSRLYIDFSAYYSVYTNFIGNIRVAQPLDGAIAGEESGLNAVLTHTPDNETYQLYQIPTNAKQNVSAYGFAVGFSYYFGKGISGLFNYTYANLNDKKLDDPIVPGFNTPNHKFNIGVTGRRVWKNLGFSMNFKAVGDYRWESSFGDGNVPGFYLLDAQINYEIPSWYSTFRIGGSNILNNRHIEAYGSPKIGGMIYAAWTVDLRRGVAFDKKD